MKFAKCICEECGLEYTISFTDSILEYELTCVVCKCPKVKITWIDTNGD